MLAPENEPVLDHLSVLLVEDNMVNRTLALEMLQRLGCDAMHAGNGVEALDALEKQDFDVVLMDCQMPVMDGFIATRKLRERELAKKKEPTRVVALTANALAGDREACLAAGMNDYLAKPFTLAQLRNILLPSNVSRSAANKVTLDHSAIEAVRQLDPDGNDRLLARLIALYRDDSSQLLADIDNAMKASDAEAVARAAHTLKSSSANLGATNVAAIARQIEHAARGGDLKDLRCVGDQAARATHRGAVRARSARELGKGRLMALAAGESIHVLIVDDDAGSRLLMRRALERAGFTISEAADGAAAVATVEAGACHAVLMDVEMPAMNGYEACKAIRSGRAAPIYPS
jgi:CheY-like chemotaxis protein